MAEKGKTRLAGAAAGLINGLFGGGGGMVLLPLLNRWSGMNPRAAFATCVAIILPMCSISAAIYLWQLRPGIVQLLPYLAGGLAGGILGGMSFGRVPVRVLKIIFGLFLLYAGVRYLL